MLVPFLELVLLVCLQLDQGNRFCTPWLQLVEPDTGPPLLLEQVLLANSSQRLVLALLVKGAGAAPLVLFHEQVLLVS